MEAAQAIKHNVYIDDYLDSAGFLEEPSRRATSVKHVLVGGDFHLSHWVSNFPALLEMVQTHDRKDTQADLKEAKARKFGFPRDYCQRWPDYSTQYKPQPH